MLISSGNLFSCLFFAANEIGYKNTIEKCTSEMNNTPTSQSFPSNFMYNSEQNNGLIMSCPCPQ